MSELDRWEARYSGADGMLFGAAPNAFLARQVSHLRPGWRTLALADGDGRNSVWLAEQGLSVRSVDFSPTAQARARKFAAQRKVEVEFELTDVTAYPFPDAAYDLVVIIFAQFLRPRERVRLFDGAKRALKPGGLLLMEGYRPKQLDYGTGGPKAEDQLYTRELLANAFADLDRIEIEEYDVELDEGGAHKGPSALIDLVAWK